MSTYRTTDSLAPKTPYLPTYPQRPGCRAAKRKKIKIGTSFLLQGPLGPNKSTLPTYLGGAVQTPYPGRSRNPVPTSPFSQRTSCH